jgi:hypothetical protein
MMKLNGKISDRIRDGRIPNDAINYERGGEDFPSDDAIRSAKGQGLGKGATPSRCEATKRR